MMPIWEASSLIGQKKISPLELVEEAIRRTQALGGELNAYVTTLFDEAQQEAKKLEAGRYTGRKSLLYGIPIALKDLFYTKGVLTSAGSELLADFKPDYDATITKRLRGAGAILMGKTNTSEFAFSASGELSFRGPTRNPWNPKLISGGSSGGSAIAVATGMAYMAMGSDTGGSIRIPAALCGVVGFKPSRGLTSLYGVVPASFTLDHTGPLARSVMDIAITMDLITGFDEYDPSPVRYKSGPSEFVEALKGSDDLKGVVVGVPENYFFDKTDEDVEKLVRSAIGELRELGATIKPLTIPYLDIVPETSVVILLSETAQYHQSAFRIQERTSGYNPGIKSRIEHGLTFTAAEYITALQNRDKLTRAWEEACSSADVIAVPSLPMAAYEIGTTEIVLKGQKEPAKFMCDHHTRLANIIGAPALSVPCGLTSKGLPAGLMLMGKAGGDAAVLKAGYVYEKHHPFPPCVPR